MTQPYLLPKTNKIAILASLGVHALFLLWVLPQLSDVTQDEKAKRKDSIPVITLSPLEQTRVPSLYPSLPYLDTIPTEIPEDNPLPPPPPLIPNNDPTTSSLFPDLPMTPPPPPTGLTQPLPNNANPPQGLSDVLNLPSTESQSSTNQNTIPNQQQPDQNSQSPHPDDVALRQEKLITALRERAQKLQKDDSNTTDEEATKNYISWLIKVQDATPEEIDLIATYPKDACVRQLEGTSVYGIVLDTNNKISNIDLIRSAGYPLFNEQAIAEITAKNLTNESDKPKPYQVNVKFEYDSKICPSLRLPRVESAKQPSESPQNKPESSPEEKNPQVNPKKTESNQ